MPSFVRRDACLSKQLNFYSSKTKHKEVWEVGAEVQRLIVDGCSYKYLHNPVWERIKNVAILYYKTHLNFSLKCLFVRGTCEIEVHLKRSLWKCNSCHFEVQSFLRNKHD